MVINFMNCEVFLLSCSLKDFFQNFSKVIIIKDLDNKDGQKEEEMIKGEMNYQKEADSKENLMVDMIICYNYGWEI